MEKIGEIKARFAEVGERLKKASMRTEAESAAGLLENLEQSYREDTRSGVQALIRRSESSGRRWKRKRRGFISCSSMNGTMKRKA